MKAFMRECLCTKREKQSIARVLAKLGGYYDADAVYVAELTGDGHACIARSWCREGNGMEDAGLAALPQAAWQAWLQALAEQGEVAVFQGSDTAAYARDMLTARGAESMLAAAMMPEEGLVGYLAVEHPRCHADDLLVLSVMSNVCYASLSAWRTTQAEQEQFKFLTSLGEIYTSMYDIDLISGQFHEITSVGKVHAHIGSSGDAQERLNYFSRHMVAPDYTDDMLAFVNLTTLSQRLQRSRIIVKQYLSSMFGAEEGTDRPTWRECCFIEAQRDDKGRLTRVLFTTKSVQQARTEELESQQRLQASNDTLTAQLKDEQQYTAIIGALSNVYFGLFFMDVKANTFQEIITVDNIHRILGEKNDARDALRSMMQELASPLDQQLVQQFLDFDSIDQRLGQQSIITVEFMAREGGWVRCALIPVARDSHGNNQTVLLALRRITAEKEAVTFRDSLIQALAISYENVYAINAETKKAICYRMGQAINERYGEQFASGNYEPNIRAYVDNDVLAEDRHFFDAMLTVAGLNQLMADRDVYSFNYRVFRNGSLQYFQCQLVKSPQAQHAYVIAFRSIHEERMQELAQQRRVEEANAALEKANAFLEEEIAISKMLTKEYSSLFKIDINTGAISLYRTDGRGISHTQLEQLMQLGSYETVVTRYIDAFIVPEDRERIRQSSRLAVLRAQVPEDGLYKQSFRRIVDGTISYYEMNVARIHGSSGQDNFIMGMRDVDALTRHQLRQTQEIEMQREIIAGLSMENYSVLLVDPETDKVTIVREDGEEGREISAYFSKSDFNWSRTIVSYAQEMVAPSSRPEFLEKLSLAHIREDGRDYAFTYEKLTDTGVRYLQARISFVHKQHGGMSAVIATRSVDDLIRKERQQEMALQAAFDAAEAANKAKTDFLANMSHDIRTPMNGIIGMTAIAATHIDDKERVQDSLQKIIQASKHLLSLINEVLDMSKIESGKVKLIEDEFNLCDLVDNLLTMTNPQLEEHHHRLSVNIDGVVHEGVVGDSLRIQKVFTNLMSNAVKYTPDGGNIRLTITEKPCNQAKVGCYEFVFEDNGIGMSEEFLEHLFEPFVRAGDSRVSKIQGTGLGMPICRNIVRMMGGDIKVDSRLGEGSRFTVTMYLKLQDTAEISNEKFVDLHVLVADDDALSLESCCCMLNELGMQPDGVSSGREALAQVIAHHERKQEYFACIIDWRMPEMDGIATTRAIRRAVGKDVPIIIISAYDWTDIEQEARAAGANAFISKPLFRSRLARTFSALVNEEEPQSHELPLTDIEHIDLSDRRALLVEDNDLNAEIAQEILQMTGLAVERVVDGVEAVDRMNTCADGYYDIVFMDIQMPRMNGYDATRAIRAMNRSYCQQLPIIAMTANAFAEDVMAAKTVGMNEHIAKPMDLSALARALIRWLL
ncbi:MAG: response regulator [Aristaeellaceae bacterium]